MAFPSVANIPGRGIPRAVFRALALFLSLVAAEAGALEGRVLAPDGSPAVGAVVRMLKSGPNAAVEYAFLNGEPIPPSEPEGDPKRPAPFEETTTDAEGRFSVSDQALYLMLIVHETGIRTVSAKDLMKSREVRLEAWARIEGRVARGGVPEAGRTVQAIHTRSDTRATNAHALLWSRTTTDAEGRFAFERVPPGLVVLGPMKRERESSSPAHIRDLEMQSRATLAPGSSTTLNFGGEGARVVARAILPEGFEDAATSEDFHVGLGLRLPVDPPEETKSEGNEAVAAWRTEWLASPEGLAHQAKVSFRSAKPEPDGSVVFEDVTPGRYFLSFRLAKPEAYGSTPVEVKSADERIDAGEVKVALVERKRLEPLKIGQAAPDFDVPAVGGEATGARVRLADFRGRYVLLDFWATWCGPCIREMPTIEALHSARKDDPRLAIVSLSLDELEADVTKFLKRRSNPWVQGFLGEWSKTDLPDRYGVSGIPAIFLLDPEGKVAATGLRGAKIREAVDAALGAPPGAEGE